MHRAIGVLVRATTLARCGHFYGLPNRRFAALGSCARSLPIDANLLTRPRQANQELASVRPGTWPTNGPHGRRGSYLGGVASGYYHPLVIRPRARRSVPMYCVIAAALACAIVTGCGASQPRQTAHRRLPVYAAGKLIGYCHGYFSGSGPSVSFHTEWRRGSHEASLCAGGISERVYDALYKVAGSHGLNGTRLLRLVRVPPSAAVNGRIVDVYTTTAKLVGFCSPGDTTGSLVCAREGRQTSIYDPRAKLLGQCTPGQLMSGQGNLVCTEEVPREGPGSVAA